MPSLVAENVRSRDGFDVEWSQTLEEFGARLASALCLPAFDYDAENVYEWGQTLAEDGSVEVNISRKHGWDGPPSDTLSVVLMVSKDAPDEWDEAWMTEHLLPLYRDSAAAITGTAPIFSLLPSSTSCGADNVDFRL